MRVLLADGLDQTVVAALEAAGHEVEVRPELTADSLPDNVAEVDVLVVRSTRVTSATIAAAPQLSLIVRAGAGTENIDVEAASGHGIHVCNVPGRNAVAVAELAIGLLLAVDRHIAAATSDLREGVWNKSTYSKADGLLGRSIGIVGLGEIGLCVAERAKAFGLVVIGLRKPNRSDATEGRIRSIGIRLVDDLEELVAASDIVSLHVPGGAATESLVDAELLTHFRDGATLINTSRGNCVDEAALIAAMDSRGLRAGVDVYCNEPASGDRTFTSALAAHPGVVGTHHIGASTQQAQVAVARGVFEVVDAFASGHPLHCINLVVRGQASCTLTIRHFDRVGVLASIFALLRGGGLNVQHMENRVFSGGQAAVASVDVIAPLTDDLRVALLALPDVLGVTVATRP